MPSPLYSRSFLWKQYNSSWGYDIRCIKPFHWECCLRRGPSSALGLRPKKPSRIEVKGEVFPAAYIFASSYYTCVVVQKHNFHTALQTSLFNCSFSRLCSSMVFISVTKYSCIILVVRSRSKQRKMKWLK